MGIDVRRTQREMLVGTAVSVSGIIGFVGLVVPHVMRFCLGSDHRY
ncbi:Hemin transport system permease protein HmuU|nr:Hemin transport system permease protein HmuU [Candidatus Pantoea persica]